MRLFRKRNPKNISTPDLLVTLRNAQKNAAEAIKAQQAGEAKRFIKFIAENVGELPPKQGLKIARWGIRNTADFPDLRQEFIDAQAALGKPVAPRVIVQLPAPPPSPRFVERHPGAILVIAATTMGLFILDAASRARMIANLQEQEESRAALRAPIKPPSLPFDDMMGCAAKYDKTGDPGKEFAKTNGMAVVNGTNCLREGHEKSLTFMIDGVAPDQNLHTLIKSASGSFNAFVLLDQTDAASRTDRDVKLNIDGDGEILSGSYSKNAHIPSALSAETLKAYRPMAKDIAVTLKNISGGANYTQ